MKLKAELTESIKLCFVTNDGQVLIPAAKKAIASDYR